MAVTMFPFYKRSTITVRSSPCGHELSYYLANYLRLADVVIINKIDTSSQKILIVRRISQREPKAWWLMHFPDHAR
jgi:predicted GTPase